MRGKRAGEQFQSPGLLPRIAEENIASKVKKFRT
jgi:hypothetical protein